ncbi:MAG: hypothetical protein ACRCWG_00285 [Sarcina sp.]
MKFLYESALEYSRVLMNPIFLLALAIMGFRLHKKNKNIKKGQRLFVKGYPERALDMTLSSIALGLIFGFIILVGYRVIVGEIDLMSEFVIMFCISILASNLSSRFICFAYSGSVICLILLVMGRLMNNLELAQVVGEKAMNIIVLVGIVHIIEAILVFFDGGKGIIYYYRDTEGEIIGAYKLSRRWVIPLLSLFICVGYSGMSYTMTKSQKLKDSALKTGVYGIFIIVLARLSEGIYILELITTFSMVIGHEFVAGYMFKREKNNSEIFISNDGISVLDSLKCGKAKEVGINQADKITHINGIKTNDVNFLEQVINAKEESYIKLTVKKYNGNIEEYELKLESIEELGVVLVPAKLPKTDYNDYKSLNFSFKEVLENIEI